MKKFNSLFIAAAFVALNLCSCTSVDNNSVEADTSVEAIFVGNEILEGMSFSTEDVIEFILVPDFYGECIEGYAVNVLSNNEGVKFFLSETSYEEAFNAWETGRVLEGELYVSHYCNDAAIYSIEW